MKIILINPNRRFAKGNIWHKIHSVMPPLGLALLAGILKKAGHIVQIIDGYALNLTDQQILRNIDTGIDLVGMSAMTVEIENVVLLARRIRAVHPHVKIVFGGVHPTFFHRQLVEEGVCDIVVRNEGEESIVQLAEGDAPETISGITWRDKDGRITINEDTGRYADLDRLPYPAYDLLPMRYYRSALGAAKNSPSIGMITSRGCPGQCTFCFSGMFGRKIRYIAPEIVLDHMLHLKTHYGIREISFYDDTFTSNLDRIETLCELLIKHHVNMTWSCFARVDSTNADVLNLMHTAGCHQIMYGFEAVNEKTLKTMNKSIRKIDYKAVTKMTRKADIDVRGAFMLGSPGEIEYDIQQTLAYSREMGIQFAIYNITTPYPGTAMYEWAIREGLLSHTDWRRYDLSHVILNLPSVSRETVQYYYDRSFRDFYLRPAYILNRVMSVRTLQDLRTYLHAFAGILRHVFQ